MSTFQNLFYFLFIVFAFVFWWKCPRRRRRRTAMSMVTEDKISTLAIGAANGTYTTDFTERTYVLRVHEYDGYTVNEIKVNGQTVNFDRIERADAYTENGGIPFATEGASCDTDVVTITFTAALDSASEITVSYN